MSIQSELERISAAKNDLASSIAAKGVTVPAAATLEEYSGLVASIPAGANITIDPTLTRSGQAADAKATGDRLTALEDSSIPTVANVEEMTDTSRRYVLASTGTIWEWQESTSVQTITEPIEGTSDNPFADGHRLSNGNAVDDAPNACTTPYIDLLAAPSGKVFGAGESITLNFGGVNYVATSDLGSHWRTSFYAANKGHIKTGNTYQYKGYYPYNTVTHDSDGTAHVTYIVGSGQGYDSNIRYIRLCAGTGTEAASDLSISYTATVTARQWVDTGVSATSISDADVERIAALVVERIDSQLLTLIGDGGVA